MDQCSLSSRRRSFRTGLTHFAMSALRYESLRACGLPKLEVLETGRSVGDEVSEMRLDVGPGYRLHFTRRGSVLIVMLVGRRQINAGA